MLLLNFKKYPALYTLLPVSAGILISYRINLQIPGFTGAYFTATAILSALTAVLIYPRIRYLFSYNYLAYFFIVLIFGLLSMQYSYYKKNDTDLSSYLNQFKYGNVNLYGTIQDDPDVNKE